MAETPRLNGAIRALESGKPAFVTFAAGGDRRRAKRRRGRL